MSRQHWQSKPFQGVASNTDRAGWQSTTQPSNVTSTVKDNHDVSDVMMFLMHIVHRATEVLPNKAFKTRVVGATAVSCWLEQGILCNPRTPVHSNKFSRNMSHL